MRVTPGGQQVATFGVATNRAWRDSAGAKQEAVEFHTVVAWGKLAELSAAYLTKGSLAFIEGRLETRTWNDKQGVKHGVTQVVATEIQFGPAPSGAKAAFATATAAHKPATPVNDDVRIVADEEDPGRSLEPLFADEEIKPEDIPF